MENKLGLAFKLTNWCNMNCAHCCERSGSHCEPALMSIDKIADWTAQFQKLENPKWSHLVFTGGETMAPYYFGAFDYLPKCLDVTYANKMNPVLKTNGMWGAKRKYRELILNDLMLKALHNNIKVTVEISLDEFHNNIDEIARILSDVFHNTLLMQTIQIHLVGLDTTESCQRLTDLLRKICTHGLRFSMREYGTLLIGSGNGYRAPVYYGFDTPVSYNGRAIDNKLPNCAVNNGMPSSDYGNCLTLDNYDTAILNYKWRAPVAGRPLADVVTQLMSNTRGR